MLTAAGIAALHGALADGTTDVPPSSKAVTVVSALPPPCPATAPCKLGIGKAYGDPWVSAEAGDANYFKVKFSRARNSKKQVRKATATTCNRTPKANATWHEEHRLININIMAV